MPKIIFNRGTSDSLREEELKDGLLSFTTDDGKIHLDYIDENNALVRKTFYGNIEGTVESIEDDSIDGLFQ